MKRCIHRALLILFLLLLSGCAFSQLTVGLSESREEGEWNVTFSYLNGDLAEYLAEGEELPSLIRADGCWQAGGIALRVRQGDTSRELVQHQDAPLDFLKEDGGAVVLQIIGERAVNGELLLCWK